MLLFFSEKFAESHVSCSAGVNFNNILKNVRFVLTFCGRRKPTYPELEEIKDN